MEKGGIGGVIVASCVLRVKKKYVERRIVLSSVLETHKLKVISHRL